jgi:hypothetical protein
MSDILADLRTLTTDINDVLTVLSNSSVLGIRLGIIYYLLSGFVIYLLVWRLTSSKVAFLSTLLFFAAKQGTLELLRSASIAPPTTDGWLVVSNGLYWLLGMKGAIFTKRFLPPKQDQPSLEATRTQLPPTWQIKHHGLAAVLICSLPSVFFAALLIGHWVALPSKAWGHITLTLLVVGACFAFKPVNVLVFTVPILPFINWIGRSVGLYHWHLRLSETLVLTLATYVFISRMAKRQRTQKHLPIDVLILGYSVFAIIAVGVSLRSTPMTLDKARDMMSMAQAISIYFLMMNLLECRNQIGRAAWMSVLSTALLCLIALIEYLFTGYDPVGRHPRSVYITEEQLATHLVITGPMLFAWAALLPGWRRWVGVVGSFLVLVTLMVTHSRQAWVGTAVVLPMVILCAVWSKDRLVGVLALFLLLSAGVIIGSTLNRAALAPTRYQSGIVREVLTLSPNRLWKNFENTRGYSWKRMIPRARLRPLLGHPGTHGWKASLYLLLLEDNGLIAASCVILAMFWIMVHSLFLAGRIPSPLLMATATGAALAVLSVLSAGISDAHPMLREYVPITWYTFMLGPATIAVCRPKPQPKETEGASNHQMLHSLLLCIAASILVVIFYYVLAG